MTDQAPPKTKRGRGRPPKYAGTGRRNFNFRITEKTRQRLIETVKETGRSLSEEIEWRIDHSFLCEDILGDVKDYERRAKRAIDIQQGRTSPPGRFVTEEEARALIKAAIQEELPGGATSPKTPEENQAESAEVRRMAADPTKPPPADDDEAA
jgi:TraY domain